MKLQVISISQVKRGLRHREPVVLAETDLIYASRAIAVQRQREYQIVVRGPSDAPSVSSEIPIVAVLHS